MGWTPTSLWHRATIPGLERWEAKAGGEDTMVAASMHSWAFPKNFPGSLTAARLIQRAWKRRKPQWLTTHGGGAGRSGGRRQLPTSASHKRAPTPEQLQQMPYTATHGNALRCEGHLLVAWCHLDSRSRGRVSHSGISKAEGEDIVLQISWTCLNHWRRCPGPEYRNLQDSSQSLAGSCARLWFVVPGLTGDQSGGGSYNDEYPS